MSVPQASQPSPDDFPPHQPACEKAWAWAQVEFEDYRPERPLEDYSPQRDNASPSP